MTDLQGALSEIEDAFEELVTIFEFNASGVFREDALEEYRQIKAKIQAIREAVPFIADEKSLERALQDLSDWQNADPEPPNEHNASFGEAMSRYHWIIRKSLEAAQTLHTITGEKDG